MDKKFLICCISVTVCGSALFISTIIFIKQTDQFFGWCIGLGAALIVLGLGFLLRYIGDQQYRKDSLYLKEPEKYGSLNKSKERAGYLVCKIMMLLLCINIYIIKNMEPDPFILVLAIALVAIQFLMDIVLQLYLSDRK